jgi:hypothetical protein
VNAQALVGKVGCVVNAEVKLTPIAEVKLTQGPDRLRQDGGLDLPVCPMLDPPRRIPLLT